VEVGDIRKRVRHTIDASRRAAAARRVQVADAERDGAGILAGVVSPLFTVVAAALKAEGYRFRMLTPAGAVRLASEAASDDYIEVALDTLRDPPALVGRTSRSRGRRVMVDEAILREAAAIRGLTPEDLLEFILERLGPFVSR
jgi:hypothetical protein